MRLKPFPYNDRQVNKPWAEFAVGPVGADGPSYEEDTYPTDSTCKVSHWNLRPEQDWESVLLARLCFKPDRERPTSGP